MKIYVSQLSHYTGMVQDMETIMHVNRFYHDELVSRGFEATHNPQEADIMLMLPTYQYDATCMAEYDSFKNDLIILTDIEQIVELAMEACA